MYSRVDKAGITTGLIEEKDAKVADEKNLDSELIRDDKKRCQDRLEHTLTMK